MSPCPSRDSLQGLLDECLSEGRSWKRSSIHVEICPSCQELLEKLTRGQGWKSTDARLLGGGRARDRGSADEADPARGSTDEQTGDLSSAGLGSNIDLKRACAWLTWIRNVDRPERLARVPGYEIVDRLGEGGMGVVYKARQVGLNRLVALKMIRGGSQARPEQLIRFSIEAEAVARLRHLNIIQIFDIGEVDGSPYVSLELLEGGSLADRLKGTPQPGRTCGRAARDAGAGHRRSASGRDHSPRFEAVERLVCGGRRAQSHRLRAGQAA